MDLLWIKKGIYAASTGNKSCNPLLLSVIILLCVYILNGETSTDTEQDSLDNHTISELSAPEEENKGTGRNEESDPDILMDLASKDEEKELKPFRQFGIGLNTGIHIFYPREVNDYTDKIYEKLMSAYGEEQEYGSYNIDREIEKREASNLIPGLQLNPHVRFDPKPYISVIPNAGIFATKTSIMVDNYIVTIYFKNYSFGSQIAGIINPRKSLSVKLGINIAYAITRIEVEDKNKILLKGSGTEITPTAGLIFNPGKGRISINLDFFLPVYKRDLEIESDSTDPEEDIISDIQKPEEINFTGFGIKPGVTFKF